MTLLVEDVVIQTVVNATVNRDIKNMINKLKKMI